MKFLYGLIHKHTLEEPFHSCDVLSFFLSLSQRSETVSWVAAGLCIRRIIYQNRLFSPPNASSYSQSYCPSIFLYCFWCLVLNIYGSHNCLCLKWSSETDQIMYGVIWISCFVRTPTFATHVVCTFLICFRFDNSIGKTKYSWFKCGLW